MDVEKAKEKFTRDLQRYYFQLTQGCGKPDCKSTRCASNLASPLTPNQAAVEALQLAKEANPFYVCRSADIDTLDFKSLESIVNDCKKEGSYSKLSKKLFNVFSNIENIDLSFLKASSNIQDVDLGLDIPALTQAFQLLKSLGPEATNPLVNALESLLANSRRSFTSWTNQQCIRFFIILFECPILEDASSHERVLTPLCTALIGLPKNLQERLIKYWSTFSHQKFHSLLSILHQAITFRILLPPFVESVNTDKVIITATKAMSLLYQAKLLPYTDFQNDLISEKLDIGEDYVNWVQGGNRILHVESVVQQRRQRMAAFQQMMMGNFELPALAFKVRRDNLIPDSIEALSRYDPDDLKKELKIKFVGEEAVDEGGVKKEWFQLLLRHIFDPKYGNSTHGRYSYSGMFVHNPQTRMDWFNHHSMDFIEFELIGKLLGLAIYNDVILDLHFPHVLYKKLCGIPVTFEDLKETHPDLAKGFEDLLNYMGDDVEDTFCLTFQISEEVFGERQFVNLKPDGDKVTVTNENRQEYVNLYMKYLLEDSIQKQFEYFERGFKYLSNTPAFKLFRWEEIELLICGSPELDFEALERNTQYDSGYSKDHPVIKNFWNVVHSLPVDKKKRLLFFATGSDRSPIGGLANMPFVISRHGEDSDRLPSAHTCFNHLLLPEYSSLDKLRERLLAAIENAEGFGML